MIRPLFVCFTLSASSVLAQSEPSSTPSDAAGESGHAVESSEEPKRPATETIVSDTRTGGLPLLEEAQSVGVLTTEELRRNTGVFLEESLNLLPGVRYENRTVSGGQRITIRGYGNSTNFNASGIRAYLDGIPLTDAEGVTIFDDLDVPTLGRVEVIRGPASSLYGMGIGGVARFFTARPRAGMLQVSQRLLAGSYGLLRSDTRVEQGGENASLFLNYGHQESDGYRVHSNDRKDTILFSGEFRPSARQSVTVLAAYTRSYENLSGQLTEEQFLNEEDVAEPAYLANDAHVGLNSVRFGISHRYDFLPWLSNTTSGFTTGYQVDQPFAAGRTDNLAMNFGGRTEFDLKFQPLGHTLTGAVGAEVQQTSSFKKSYGLTNGVLGGIRGDLQVSALQANTFTEWALDLPLEFALTAGGSVNFVRYHIRDRLTNSANPTHLDQSGLKTFDPVFTPRLALMKAFAENMSVYAQVSEGYTPPTSGQVVIPQAGTVNLDLSPERGTLYEVGTKGIVLASRLSWEAALFNLRVSNKLTPQAVTDPDTGSTLYTITTNGGAQNNLGFELATRYAVIADANAELSRVEPFASYTFSNFRYSGFKSDNNNNDKTVDYTGHRVVGIARNVVALGADIMSRRGAYLNGTWQYVDRVPLTYDNAHFAPAFNVLNAKVGYRHDLPAGFRIDAAAGADNLLGNRYYTMVFLNANYAGPPPNVYLNGPSKPVFYGNVTLSYSLKESRQ
ncbi:TonB-dependent receptor [Pyxidicoccus parkwayensis]|uniref:TonB-dependent receptor n=1 Tax=Pyxidicoccus parkwayensis TaxID=2813578 RepID=A0ABX7P8E1_9BACT|nr:TonB-dependent receptor [Pyxidicoccus parkwaysis]QSQ26717.1 TonB-dependent receptor [Pyxidicoccus parkwaysis]